MGDRHSVARRGYAALARSLRVSELDLDAVAGAEATLVRMEPVEVRRSPRARRWRLEVPWGEPARLTVPRWTSRAEGERVLAEKQTWIEEQRRRQVPRLGLERDAVRRSEEGGGAPGPLPGLAREGA